MLCSCYHGYSKYDLGYQWLVQLHSIPQSIFEVTLIQTLNISQIHESLKQSFKSRFASGWCLWDSVFRCKWGEASKICPCLCLCLPLNDGWQIFNIWAIINAMQRVCNAPICDIFIFYSVPTLDNYYLQYLLWSRGKIPINSIKLNRDSS
jgi:hypothetical protein